MKAEILNTIKNPNLRDNERFNLLYEFYKQSPSKDRNLESNFNRIGFTTHNYSRLVYEVKKVYKISDVELFQHQYEMPEIRKPWGFCETPEEKCTMSYCDENGCQNRVRHLVSDSPAHTELNQPKEDTLPIREEFSFLNNPDCPEEFKILVADKISAYQRMVTGRGALEDPNTPEEQRAEIAQAVAEADELNSLIYDELKHYQDTGEILGNHEIFKIHNLKKSIDLMTAEAKVQRVETIKKAITATKRQKTTAEKDKDADKIAELNTKLANLEIERDLVIKSLEKSNN